MHRARRPLRRRRRWSGRATWIIPRRSGAWSDAAADYAATADTMTMRSGAMRPGGQPNMQQIMKQAQKMQQQVAQAQAELAETELTGTAGGGLVTVVVTGLGEYKSVKIDPKAVDPDDVESLEDLVLAALHNAAEAQRELTEQKMGPATGGMSLPGF